MTPTPGTMRKVRDLLTRLADGTGVDLGLLAQYRLDAARLLPLVQERKAPAKALPGESIAGKRERKRATHREETAAIRAAVWARAEGVCEWEGVSEVNGLPMRCYARATELHHLEGGSGRRRQRQTVENCRAYCFECHRAAHRASRRSAP